MTEQLAPLPRAIPPLWAHQTEALEKSANKPAFFLSMEQRTGKTRVVIKNAATLFEAKVITALLIVAMPSGVHRNWITDELPAWWPSHLQYEALVWNASKVGNKSFQNAIKELLINKHNRLAVLAVNGEAIITKAFKEYIVKFLRSHKVLACADETTLIMKTPGSQRNKVMQAIGKLAPVRRCLDGTPAGEGPLDLFTQYNFLDPRILGYPSFYAFRNRYAVMEDGYAAGGRKFRQVTGFQNLDELNAKIAPYTFRVTRKDVFDAPDKIYQKRPFDLSPEQRRVYETLKEEYEADLKDGSHLSATHVLTRYLRLQQITSNFWPATITAAICSHCEGDGCDRCGGLGAIEKQAKARPIDTVNPRLDALCDELKFSQGPAIVWARFRQDAHDILGRVRGATNRVPVHYFGDEGYKAHAKNEFQTGKADVFVANPKSAGRGLRLDAALTHIFYSNDFSLLVRLQAEDRSELAERKFSTGIVDLIATNTVDETIVDTLRAKKKLTDVVMNEKSRPFL